ncbi:flavodoxin domain-containing protein [Iodobacter sp. CM08]|uniref:flavodoxin domain-containing protein n=1 Tax=Iodobacter sp. CM08 TaxID=3085902 RepID=UPI002980C896|nr:flavodoxin domain-containing protein [Iodobacter sp. CM08]MDW5415817.1 flavodoxin domain-containing protein [Iodobacter sp. CM08]
MKPALILYASYDGQAERIARTLALYLSHHALAVELCNIKQAPSQYDHCSAIIMVAAVRYGRHLPEVATFLRSAPCQIQHIPLAIASVSLSARKDNGEPNRYLSKLISQFNLTPFATIALAGKLDYPRYSWLDKQMIRFIMYLSGGPSDGRCSVEYTDWQQLAVFAQKITAHLCLPTPDE